MSQEHFGLQPKTIADGPQTIPLDVLRPRMDVLVETFRGKLAQSQPFRDALAHNYLYGHTGNLEEVEFQQGGYNYFVYLAGVEDWPEEDREAAMSSGVGPETGWKSLRIGRSTSKDFQTGFVYHENLRMFVSVYDIEGDRTKTEYINYRDHIKEVNTPIALEKAEEIIDSF